MFEDIKAALIKLVNSNGKDDVKFTLISNCCSGCASIDKYYFDNCLKLNDPMEYSKGQYAIRALLYDGDLRIVTKPSKSPAILQEYTLTPEEQKELLSIAKASI